MNTKTNPYDQIPYQSHPYSASHPGHMAVIATLFGLSPTALEHCRVLEIGCAGAENLFPLAIAFPNAQFVGIDYSQVQITAAQATQKELQLNNIEFHCENLSKVDPKTLGQFDYIIAHGIYSWLPSEEQPALLKLCKECLRENGITYISYNTLPGWHTRSMLRDFMFFHASGLGDGPPDVSQSKALLEFMGTHLQSQNKPFSQYLQTEIERFTSETDATYLAHDYLEQNNKPIYFHEFVARARDAGLDYLGESEFFTMLGTDITDEAKIRLSTEVQDIVRLEQYFDFMNNRGFRMTLLVHQNTAISRQLTSERIFPLWVSAITNSGFQGSESTKALSSNSNQKYQPIANGAFLNTTSPIVKATLLLLEEAYPANITFEKLLLAARERLTKAHLDSVTLDQDRLILANALIAAYSVNIIELRTASTKIVPLKGVHARTQNLVVNKQIRLQASNGYLVSNLKHRHIQIDEPIRQILLLLDGTRDHTMLLDALYELVNNEILAISNNKGKVVRIKPGSPEIEVLLTKILDTIAYSAMLDDQS
jgi:methyltransferase-like protein/ubiquinone/menaquinone biosynthesis C-methylase UbiE